jgi:hypothetical protein
LVCLLGYYQWVQGGVDGHGMLLIANNVDNNNKRCCKIMLFGDGVLEPKSQFQGGRRK